MKRKTGKKIDRKTNINKLEKDRQKSKLRGH